MRLFETGQLSVQRWFQRCTDWLFSAQPTVRARSSMAMLAVLLMAGSAGIMLWLGYSGVGSLQVIVWWAVFAVGGLAIMAAMVRWGWSAHWRDPAMTFPQIVWAIAACAVAYVLAGEAKGIVPGGVAITMLFAALRLRAKQMVVVFMYAVGAFSVAVLVVMHSGNTEPSVEIAYAMGMVLVLLGAFLLSLRLHQLRMRLHQQRRDLAAALEENRELASRDVLTGLVNRRHMLELLELERSRCTRGVRTMLLAQMDIDYFKSINDTYGHATGDMALQAFAEVARGHIRDADVLSRWGGEEFVLLLSDTEMADALKILHRIREAVQFTVIPGAPVSLKMTVSIGVTAHRVEESLEETLGRADQALYCAKRMGRNHVACDDDPCVRAHGSAAPVLTKAYSTF